NEHRRRLLTLEFVDRSDPGALGQRLSEQINLQVIGADHQNVGNLNWRLFPVAINPSLLQKISIKSVNLICFLLARLAAVCVMDLDEADPCGCESFVGAGIEHKPLASVVRIRLKSALIKCIRHEPADVRMHPARMIYK